MNVKIIRVLIINDIYNIQHFQQNQMAYSNLQLWQTSLSIHENAPVKNKFVTDFVFSFIFLSTESFAWA